jgi:hypothetical protein
MWRKGCPWLTGALAVALIAATWRLRDAQIELDRIERLVALRQALGTAPPSIEPPPAADRAVLGTPEPSPVIAGEPSDMSSEWEQAVPPMDS